MVEKRKMYADLFFDLEVEQGCIRGIRSSRNIYIGYLIKPEQSLGTYRVYPLHLNIRGSKRGDGLLMLVHTGC